jgi:cytochrome c oxidase subunit 2
MKVFVRSALAAISLAFAGYGTAAAMPPFAEAYGMKCSVCHTQVPALNAYGRYVQRTGYSSLDIHTMRRTTPFWVGETANYSHNSTDGSISRFETGNVALHAAGALSRDFTFHFQQWITQNGQSGGIDTAWITYNGLFGRNGHVFLGKMPGTTASPLSQWFDIASFATPELVVGEHVYQNDGNRWGSKFTYVKNSLDAEAGYFAAGGDLGGISDWSNDTEKTFQWRLAHADPEQPLEYGVMGARGSFPLADGTFDQYTSLTPYLQRDPVGNVPGIFAMYHMAYDANAGADALGNPLGAARSNAATLELYKPVGDKALIAVRKEFTNDGLGAHNQSGNIDFAYHVAPFMHVYLETAMAQNATPTWKYMIWLTLPLQKVLPLAGVADVVAPLAVASVAPAKASVGAKTAVAGKPSIAGTHIVVTITASNWKFTPAAITMHAGQTTKLRLTSTSGVHGIQSPDLGIPLTVIPEGKSLTINVTPKTAGSYVLHCAIMCGPGHEHMSLTIKVLP